MPSAPDYPALTRPRDPGLRTPAKAAMWPSQVQAAQMLGAGVVQLTLQLAKGAALQFLPGQLVRMHWGRSQPRVLAIANAPRHQGNRSIELHLTPPLQPAQDACPAIPPVHAEVMLEGPLGTFHWRSDCERPAVLLASDSGIAPIKSIVEHVLNEHLQRPLHLYWTAPSAERFYLNAQALDWAERNDYIYYTPVLAHEVCGTDWYGRRGELLDVLAEDLPNLSAYQVYLCAGPGLVDAARQRLLGPLRADPLHVNTCELGLAWAGSGSTIDTSFER